MLEGRSAATARVRPAARQGPIETAAALPRKANPAHLTVTACSPAERLGGGRSGGNRAVGHQEGGGNLSPSRGFGRFANRFALNRRRRACTS